MNQYRFDGRRVVMRARHIPLRMMSGENREYKAAMRYKLMVVLMEDGDSYLLPASMLELETNPLSPAELADARTRAEGLLAQKRGEARAQGLIHPLCGEKLDVVQAAFARAAQDFASGGIAFQP